MSNTRRIKRSIGGRRQARQERTEKYVQALLRQARAGHVQPNRAQRRELYFGLRKPGAPRVWMRP